MSKCSINQKTTTQQGMALVAVLWIVAALSVMAMGLSQSARQEIQMASTARQLIMGEALGEAAIYLALQEILTGTDPIGQLTTGEVSYQGHAIQVQVLPLNGLIDLNNAPEALLASLFEYAGGVASQNAEALAKTVIETRDKKDSLNAKQNFAAIEDLLRVPDINYDLYAKIRSLVTVNAGGSGRINPKAAPEGVLMVLAQGNPGLVANLMDRRDSKDIGMDTSALNGMFLDASITQNFMFQAKVALADGGWVVTSRSIRLGDGIKQGLPWRILHTESRLQTQTSVDNSI